MPAARIDLRNRPLAVALAWLVPGLGHFYQRRWGKGVLYAVCILGLYTIGLLLGGGRNLFWTWTNPLANSEGFRFSFLCQGSFGIPFLLGVLQATLKYYGHAPILWGILAEPSQSTLNALHPALGKFVEVAWLYITIAGLLNVLAIFDAYEGPAAVEEPDPAPVLNPIPSEAASG